MNKHEQATNGPKMTKLMLVAAFLCVPLLSGLGSMIADERGIIGGYGIGTSVLIMTLAKYRGSR
jgi:hypothetical protein